MDIELFKKSCECFEDMEDTDVRQFLERFLRFFSHITCWDKRIGETGDVSDRIDVIRLYDYVCGGCSFTVYPYYKFLDPTSISITLVTINGASVEETLLKDTEWYYDSLTNEFKIAIEDHNCGCGCQVCPKEYQLRLHYRAGVPYDYWMDPICQLANIFRAKARGCSTDECLAMDSIALGSFLKIKKVGDITRTWGVDKTDFGYVANLMMTKYYFSTLRQAALCGRTNLWKSGIKIGRNVDANQIQRYDGNHGKAFRL